MTDPLDPTPPPRPNSEDADRPPATPADPDDIIDFNTVADPEDGGSAALRLPKGASPADFWAVLSEPEPAPAPPPAPPAEEVLPFADEATLLDEVPDAAPAVGPSDSTTVFPEAEPLEVAEAEPLLAEELPEAVAEAEPVVEAEATDFLALEDVIEEAEPVAEAAEPALLDDEPVAEAAPVELAEAAEVVEAAELIEEAEPRALAEAVPEPAVEATPVAAAEAVEFPWEASVAEPAAALPAAEEVPEVAEATPAVAGETPGWDDWLNPREAQQFPTTPAVSAAEADDLLGFGSGNESDAEDAFTVASAHAADDDDDAISLTSPPSQIGGDDAFSPTSGVLFGGSDDEDADLGLLPEVEDPAAASHDVLGSFSGKTRGSHESALPDWAGDQDVTQNDITGARGVAADDLLASLDESAQSPAREDDLSAFDSAAESALDLMSAAPAGGSAFDEHAVDLGADPNPSQFWADQNSSVDLLRDSDVERPAVSDSGTVTFARPDSAGEPLPGLDISGVEAVSPTDFAHQDSASVNFASGSQPEFLELAEPEPLHPAPLPGSADDLLGFAAEDAEAAARASDEEAHDLLGLVAAEAVGTRDSDFGPAASDPFDKPVVLPGLDEEDEPAPPPRKKASKAKAVAPEPVVSPPRKGGGGGLGLVLGGFLGLLAGAGGVAGAWYAGLLPSTNTTGTPVASSPGTSPQGGVNAAEALRRGKELLAAGAVGGALDAMESAKVDPKVLPWYNLAAGQKTWLDYVRERQEAGEKLDKNADAVKAARESLDSSELPEAVLWKGLIAESLGDFKSAEEAYALGEARFKDREVMFQTARDRMNLLKPDEALPIPEVRRPVDPTAALLLAVTFLQAAGEGDEPAEAGFPFWKAQKLAAAAEVENDPAKRATLFQQASDAIRQAKAVHAKQAAGLRRGLNPQSDPLEQIFGRCCDELLVLYDLRAELYKRNGDAVRKEGLVKALQSMSAGIDEKTAAKLKDAGVEAADLGKAVDALVGAMKKAEDDAKTALADKKKADNLLAKLTTTLGDAGFKSDEGTVDALEKALTAGKTAADQLKKVGERVEAAGLKEPDAAKAVDTLAAGKKDAEAVVAEVSKKLADAKFVAADARPADLAAGLSKALETASNPAIASLNKLVGGLAGVGGGVADGVARAIDLSGQVAVSQAAATRAQLLLAKSRGPGQMLDLWLAVLPERARAEDAAAALADAEVVAADASSTPEQQAKALAVKALALKVQGDPAGARAALAKATGHPGFPKEAPWVAPVKETNASLADSGAAVKKARDLLKARDYPRARAVVTDALKSFPAEAFAKDHGRLLAVRALAAVGEGKAEEARPDAEAAVKAGVAEGHYALGRVAEAAGDRDLAIRSYSAALRATDADPELTAQARKALNRLLLEAPAAEKPTPAGVGRAEGNGLAALVLAMVLLVEPEDDDTPPVGLEPNELRVWVQTGEGMKKGEPDAFFDRARLLSRLKRHNEALKLFQKGFELKFKDGDDQEYARLLNNLLEANPALRGPVTFEAPSPTATRLFSAGVTAYHAGDFEEASRTLRAAVREFPNDARYFYYLGLTRLALGKPTEAATDFKTAATLELSNKPTPREVGRSLERIQGPLRREVDQYRP